MVGERDPLQVVEHLQHSPRHLPRVAPVVQRLGDRKIDQLLDALRAVHEPEMCVAPDECGQLGASQATQRRSTAYA